MLFCVLIIYYLYMPARARARTRARTHAITHCVYGALSTRMCVFVSFALALSFSLARSLSPLPSRPLHVSVCARACPCAMRAHVCGECACPPDSEGPTTRPPPLSPQESAVPLQPTPTPRLHQRQTAARTADAVVAPARASSGCWELLPPRLLSSVRHCEPGPEAQTCPPPRPRQRQHRRPPPPTRILRN